VTDAADRILIVDDDDDAREALQLLLEAHGYEVWTARDGAEAVAEVQRHPPALIISDLRMPGMDGFGLVEQLRARSATAHLPIILLSAVHERERRVAGLDLGADDYLTKPADPAELLARVRVHLRHAHRQQALVRRSLLDPLTGALNRRGILAVLRRERERALRTGGPLSVLMLDVDGFKELNDTYGHAIGDEVLQQIARAIVDAVRVVDHVGRIGGDEFVVAVPDGDAAAAAALAARLRVLRLGPLAVGEGGHLRVAVSVGAATMEIGESLDTLLARADAEMYRCKRARARAAAAAPSGASAAP
jgi:two-component system, cell cycle response regulator